MRWIWLFLLPIALFAKPKGHKVTHGSAKVQEMGSDMEIQTSERAIIHWDEFSIQAGETTRFLQPSTNSAVLNRVANGPSQIDGLLEANGRIYLLNPNGMLIGPTGHIQAESFIASTLDFDSDDFFKNRELLFKGDSQARIVNFGKIEALGGDVFLLAKAVINSGTLEAKEGVVGIAAGEEILLKPSGMQRLFIAPTPEAEKEDGGIENQGLIEAAAAELRADGNAFRFAINQSGVIEASGIKEENGRVFLVADGGTSVNSGVISAPGGSVHILGEQVGVHTGSKVDVSADTGGGEVLLGGDFQGNNPDICNSQMSVVMAGAEIFADAKVQGDGGKIIVWSDGSTHVEGKLSARGGPEGGDGGLMETSGAENIFYNGFACGEAPLGKSGTLLLDPSNITITTAASSNITFSAATGVYTATAATANLRNSGALNALVETLNTGNVNVTVLTMSNFGAEGDITVSDSVTWASKSNLALVADRNIIFESQNIECTGSGSIAADAKQDVIFSPSFEQLTFNGTATFIAGRDIIYSPPIAPGMVLESKGMALSAGRDIILGSETVGGFGIGLFSSSKPLEVKAGRDLKLMTINKPIEIVPSSTTARFEIGRDLILKGGNALGGFVLIGPKNSSSADLIFEVGRDVKLTGGSGQATFAHIGPLLQSDLDQNGSGSVTFTKVGGDITLLGGTGMNAYTHIGPVAGIGIGMFAWIGDVSLENVEGDILIQAQSGSAGIGLGNSKTTGRNRFKGDVTVHAIGDITLKASDEKEALIGFGVGGNGTSQVDSKGVSVWGRNLFITGGADQDAYVGFYNSAGTSIDFSDIGTVSVMTRKDIALNFGTSSDGIKGAAVIGTGGSTSMTAANVLIRGEDLLVRGLVQTNSISALSTRNVDILVDNIIVGNPSGSRGDIYASGEILAIANFDTVLHSNTTVTTKQGSLTLVVDNDKSDPYDIGDGKFIKDAQALIASTSLAAPVQIFTAKRFQNQINGQINGANFAFGPLFFDSATEVWATYYPDDFGGFPFTVFYKTGLPRSVYNALGRSFAEMFQNLHPYDDLFFDYKCFVFGYDKACYDQRFYPKGMVSSFDLFGDERYQMLRQKYRNYHIKYVESF